MSNTTTPIRTWLIRLIPLLVVCSFGAWRLEDNDTGVLGVLSYICYFGQAIVALAIIALLAVAAVRRVRRPAAG
jgi:hypothetical protein